MAAAAVRAGQALNPISEIAWGEIFPVSIAGVTARGNGSSPSGFESISRATCTCPAPWPIMQRKGIPVGFWEPARLIETVKDSYYFPSLGTKISIKKDKGDSKTKRASDGSRGSHSSGATTSVFQQAHFFIFPVWSFLELVSDSSCAESTGFDLAYMTELDPLWQEDSLTMLIQPEALLFANPIAQLACVADAIGAALDTPLDPLFWCAGSGGSVYPLTGHVSGNNFTMANATIAARILYKLSRQNLVCDAGSWECACVSAPIWNKSHYKIQVAKPLAGSRAFPFGQTDFLWGMGKNPAMGAGGNDPDNFLWILFRKRLCCAL